MLQSPLICDSDLDFSDVDFSDSVVYWDLGLFEEHLVVSLNTGIRQPHLASLYYLKYLECIKQVSEQVLFLMDNSTTEVRRTQETEVDTLGSRPGPDTCENLISIICTMEK